MREIRMLQKCAQIFFFFFLLLTASGHAAELSLSASNVTFFKTATDCRVLRIKSESIDLCATSESSTTLLDEKKILLRPLLAPTSLVNFDLTISPRTKIMGLEKESLENMVPGLPALVAFRGLVMDAHCETRRKSTNQLLSQKSCSFKEGAK